MLTRREWTAPPVLVGQALEAAEQCLPTLAGRGVSTADEDYTKPLLLGYVRRDLLVTDGQVSQLEQAMTKFALASGYSMGFTYVEKPGTWPAAFGALVESVNQYDVTAVVLPSILHFMVLDASHDMKDIFERATGVRVMVLDSP